MLFGETPPPPSPPGLYITPGVEMPAGWRLVPPEPKPVKPKYRGDVAGILFLLLILLAHIAVNCYWLRVDNHPVCLDEAHHMGRATEFYHTLFAPGADGTLARILAAVGIESPYPPLAHLLGAVSILLFGNTPDGIALSGSLSLALLLFGVYVLARQGMAAHNALLTALVVSLTPMVSGYSRLVMPDTLCGALVVWALYGLVKSDGFRKTAWVAFFSLFCSLALLTKQTAFVFLAFPMILVLLMGITQALFASGKNRSKERTRAWTGILLNLGVCVFIAVAVCSWWYFRHLEFLYIWWSTQRGHGQGIFQPGIASRLADALPAATAMPETHITLDPTISGLSPESPPASVSYPFTSLLEPFHRFWKRYLIYLVNEVAFLPLALVALAGTLALLLKRNRTALAVILVSWPVGTYLLLTGLFSLHGPRFLYGAAPALAFFAVLALDAVPFVRLRRALWGIFLIILVFQFVNLNLKSLGSLNRLEVPLLTGEAEVRDRGNFGMTVYKDVIQSGHYTIQAPRRGRQMETVVLEAVAAHESRPRETTPEAPLESAAAWYQVVSPVYPPLSLDFYARHYAPAAGKTGLDAPILPRPFAAIKPWSPTPEDTLPELAETEYVILYQPLTDNYIETLEHSVYFFREYGFESLLNAVREEGEPAWVHVLARKAIPTPENVKNIFELYDLLAGDGKNYLLPDEERAALERQYTREAQQYTNNIQKINNYANLLGFHVERSVKDWFLIRLVLHCGAVPEKNLRVWLRAVVHEEDREGLFEAQKQQSALVWDFTPTPPSTEWKQNQAMVFTRPVMAPPLRYQVDIGMYDPEQEERPVTVTKTEWVDFGSVE